MLEVTLLIIRFDCILELAYKVTNELEVFCIVEELQLHKSLILSFNMLVKWLLHAVDRYSFGQLRKWLNFIFGFRLSHDDILVVNEG